MHMGHILLAWILALMLFMVLLFQYMPCSKLYGISNRLECVVSDWRFPIDFRIEERLRWLVGF